MFACGHRVRDPGFQQSHGVLLVSSSGRLGLSEGVFLTIVCREIVPFTDEAEVEAQAGMYGLIGSAGAAMAMAPACSDWPVEPMLREDRSPVVSAAPVLFLNGAYDPVTPLEWSVEIAESFPNAAHLVFRGAGHVPSASDGCAVRTAVRFLQHSGDSEPFSEPYCRCTANLPTSSSSEHKSHGLHRCSRSTVNVGLLAVTGADSMAASTPSDLRRPTR